MLRASLLALALALAIGPACTRNEAEAGAIVELERPLLLLPVDDPSGALAAVVAAIQADPESGLDFDEAVHPVGSGPPIRESFATGPNKHVLEDYIRTHPELAPPAGFIFAYERLERRDEPARWRMYSLRQAGGIELRALAGATATVVDYRPQLHVRLGPDDARAFTALTTDLVGHRLAIVQDGEVMMAPRINEPIPGDTLVIDLGGDDPDSPEAAAAAADAALARLLSR